MGGFWVRAQRRHGDGGRRRIMRPEHRRALRSSRTEGGWRGIRFDEGKFPVVLIAGAVRPATHSQAERLAHTSVSRYRGFGFFCSL
jgi:hypothetical protein